VWQQVLKFGEDGDYVWNVASDVETIRNFDLNAAIENNRTSK
jgi:hypothetical protein